MEGFNPSIPNIFCLLLFPISVHAHKVGLGLAAKWYMEQTRCNGVSFIGDGDSYWDNDLVGNEAAHSSFEDMFELAAFGLQTWRDAQSVANEFVIKKWHAGFDAGGHSHFINPH